MFNNTSLSVGKTRLEEKTDLNPVVFLNELIIYNVIYNSFEEAIKNKNKYEAMNTEYKSLVENNFWQLVDNQEKNLMVAVGILLGS